MPKIVKEKGKDKEKQEWGWKPKVKEDKAYEEYKKKVTKKSKVR